MVSPRGARPDESTASPGPADAPPVRSPTERPTETAWSPWRSYEERRLRALATPTLGWRTSVGMWIAAGTHVAPSKRPSGIRVSAARGSRPFEEAVMATPAIEIRPHSTHRISAVDEVRPGTRVRSAPTTSTSPLPPEHPQGQTLRARCVATRSAFRCPIRSGWRCPAQAHGRGPSATDRSPCHPERAPTPRAAAAR